MRDQELLRRFLLGELRETKAERVERRLLEDDEFFELSEIVETELLDAVVRGELAPAERERVVQRLASSPQGRARLALAGELIAIANGQTKTDTMPAPLPFRPRPALTQRPAVRWAIAAGLVVLLGGTGTTWWVATHTNQEEGKIATTGQERDGDIEPGFTIDRPPAQPIGGPDIEKTPPEEEPSQNLPGPEQTKPDTDPEQTGPATPARVKATQILLAMLRGNGNLPEIRIPDGAEFVNLDVDVTDVAGEGFETYDVVLRRDGRDVWKDRFKPVSVPMKNGEDALVLFLDVPAGKLSTGKHEVEIQGNFADGTPKLLGAGPVEVTHEQ